MAKTPSKDVWRIIGKGTRPLPTPLPEDEKLIAVEKVGELDASMEEVEKELDGLKQQVKGLNTRWETLQVELRENARIVRNGSVERPINTRTEISPDSLTVQVIREDTNEVIEERAANSDEKQIKLFNEDIKAQVQEAFDSGKKDEPDKPYDLSELTPEEQKKHDDEAEEYLKKQKKKRFPKDGEEDAA